MGQSLNELEKQPKENEKQIAKLTKRKKDLYDRIGKEQRWFEQLLTKTTFDLVRWQTLGHQLKKERQQIVDEKTERKVMLEQHTKMIESLKKENETLRAEVKQLEALSRQQAARLRAVTSDK